MTEKKTNSSRWTPGQSGNPSGSKPLAPELREKLRDAAPGVIAKMVELAQAGNVRAATLILERVVPALRAGALAVQIPALDVDADLVAQGKQLLAAVAAGELAPDVGADLIAALGRLAGLKQLEQLEARIAALETGDFV